MSFKVNWSDFKPEFIEKAKLQLQHALNEGKKPKNIIGQIKVKRLDMGSNPPDLEILEITELFPHRFKGIFKMSYSGDCFIQLSTQVQANPLYSNNKSTLTGRSILFADKPLIVPMEMTISKLSLRGIIALVVDKEKGITLVFKNDPLESVYVSSTFDNIPNIKKLLQTQIENQLRALFQQELPQIIHRLSLLLLKNQPVLSSEFESASKSDTDFDSQSRHKWVGNDRSNEDQEFILYKSLSTPDLQKLDLGLVIDLNPPSRISSASIMSDTYLNATKINTLDQNFPTIKSRSMFKKSIGQLGLQLSSRFEIEPSDSVSIAQGRESFQKVYSYLDNIDSFNRTLDYEDPKLDNDFLRYYHSKHGQMNSMNTSEPSKRRVGEFKGDEGQTIFTKNDMISCQTYKRSQAPSMVSRWTVPEFSNQLDYTYEIIPAQRQKQKSRHVEREIVGKVTLTPSDNALTAHLANLMAAHHTISPNTLPLRGLFRGLEDAVSLPDVNIRKRMRRVRTVRIAKSSFCL